MLKRIIAVGLLFSFVGLQAQVDSTALAVLKESIGFLKSNTDISVTKDEVTDVIFDDTLKFQFHSRAHVKVNDDNEFSIQNTGDFGTKSYTLSDGIFTFYNEDNGFYSNVATEGNIPQVLNFCSNVLGLQVPLADIMTPSTFETLLDNLLAAVDLGESMVLGKKVRHLAFISPNFSWQIWISVEGDPVPLKYSVCETSIPGMPTYSAYFSDWKFKKIKQISAPKIDPEDVLIEFNLANE